MKEYCSLVHRPELISVLILALLACLLHFVPIYDKRGYIEETGAVTCIGYSYPQERHYRIIPNGLDEFREEKNILKSDVANTALCGIKPVSLRLYVL